MPLNRLEASKMCPRYRFTNSAFLDNGSRKDGGSLCNLSLRHMLRLMIKLKLYHKVCVLRSLLCRLSSNLALSHASHA